MYKKVRFYFRFASALISKYYLHILGGILLSIIIFFTYPHILNIIPNYRFTQKIGLIGRYTLTSLPETVTEKISLGLTTIDQSGQPGPGVAKNWEISNEGKTLTFTINSDLRWHDQSKLISSNIKYQFKDATIDYPNSDQVVFHLQDPFSPLPTLLAKPIIRFETSTILKTTKILGLGNYKITSYKSNGGVLESLTLYPVDAKSRQPIILYKFYPSSQQARTAFKLGLVDHIENLSDLGDLTGWTNTLVNKYPSTNRYVGLFFNTQSPNFSGQSGKNLRLAISYAIDKNRWANRAIGPIGPENWAFNADVKKYDKDTKRAEDLIKKVEIIPEKILIHTVPAYLSIAEDIKNDLITVGLMAEISARQDIPTDFDLLLIAQATPPDPDQYSLWHSTQSTTNLTKLNNPRIDKLLEDGRKTYSHDERLTIYRDFQKFLAEEVPAVFLFYPELYDIHRK